MVTDDRLKMLSFTGSAAVGWELKKQAGKKRVTLELGGNAAVIVHSDADLDFAAERCALGGFSYAGQTCISVQRIFVERSAFERFLEAFLPRVGKLKLGDPLDEATEVGPMISEAAAERAQAWVQEALAAGAQLLRGASPPPRGHAGACAHDRRRRAGLCRARADARLSSCTTHRVVPRHVVSAQGTDSGPDPQAHRRSVVRRCTRFAINRGTARRRYSIRAEAIDAALCVSRR
jgi:hypothetical protein